MNQKLFEAKKIHMIGIKGAGMAALAEILTDRHIRVSGSDTSEHFFTDNVLLRRGIRPIEGFSPDNIPSDVDVIIYSTAYKADTNRELAAAQERGKTARILSYPEAVGEITREHLSILVCGTHGKTTTSALLAETLKFLDADPLALIGSKISAWGGNALFGEGNHFVLEADEYQNKLQKYEPWSALLTSVDWDHPDFFPNEASYEESFREMIRRIPSHGFLVSCGDSASVVSIARESHAGNYSYGFLADNDFRVMDYTPLCDGPFRQSFRIVNQGVDFGTFRLRLAGRHNAANATGVAALLFLMKFDMDRVRAGMESFFGTARRFESVGEYNGALLYDDYAHHPEEIKSTLVAFRELFPERNIIVVFHPHTFSRTRTFLQEFAQSFDMADQVIVLDIYGSAREEQGGVSSVDLTTLINRYYREKALYIPTIEDVVDFLRKMPLTKNDLVVTMGAGDVWRIGRELLSDIR